jgi:hypothetical protein
MVLVAGGGPREKETESKLHSPQQHVLQPKQQLIRPGAVAWVAASSQIITEDKITTLSLSSHQSENRTAPETTLRDTGSIQYDNTKLPKSYKLPSNVLDDIELRTYLCPTKCPTKKDPAAAKTPPIFEYIRDPK